MRRWLAVAFTLVATMTLFHEVTYAAEHYRRVLPVAPVFQEKSNWCWAAVGSLIASWYGYETSQCQVANATPGNMCYANWQSSLDLLAFGLYHLHEITGTYRKGQLTWHELKTELDANRPVAFRQQHSKGGHVMLIVGYEELVDPDIGYRMVVFIDTEVEPAGERREMTWHHFTGKRTNWEWTHTLFELRPRNPERG